MRVSLWACALLLSLCSPSLGCSGVTICGNGIIQDAEACDDGNLTNGDGCDNGCTLTSCGNGVPTSPETCDDGNLLDGDGCASGCVIEPGFACLGTPSVCALLCGNGILDQGEDCDDGNVSSLDGCASNCTIEIGFDCAGSPGICTPICGDGLVRGTEDCDDDNSIDTDACLTVCQAAKCGDGFVFVGAEACDDGNDTEQDGCDKDCFPSRVLQLAAGSSHTCALLEHGIVRCWGHNIDGQLGYGNTDNIGDDETPASAGNVDVGGNVIQLAAGGNHTCALLDGGFVRCWGLGGFGALGYGNQRNIGDDETPASAGNVNVGGNVIQLTTGLNHTCALLAGGFVRCWGVRAGYVGSPLVGDNESPASMGDVNVGGDVIQLAAGFDHTCALLTGGFVRCWGRNINGQLGYGNIDNIGDNETPASAGDVNMGGSVIQLAAGVEHTCALFKGAFFSSIVRCWGSGFGGQLGYGNTDNIGDNETPTSAGDVNVGGNVIQLATGLNHTCALFAGGNVRCWGQGGFGALGYGNQSNIGDNEIPASAGDVPVF